MTSKYLDQVLKGVQHEESLRREGKTAWSPTTAAHLEMLLSGPSLSTALRQEATYVSGLWLVTLYNSVLSLSFLG